MNGPVTLEGVVVRQSDRDLASLVAKGVFGVLSVTNSACRTPKKWSKLDSLRSVRVRGAISPKRPPQLASRDVRNVGRASGLELSGAAELLYRGSAKKGIVLTGPPAPDVCVPQTS